MTALTQSIEFLQAGIGIFPIQKRDKRPLFRLLPVDPADQKPTWEPYKTQLPSISQVQNWFAQGAENYAVITGWRNLVILDFDDAQEYIRWSLWVQDKPAAKYVFEHAYKVRTARGVHVYIRTPGQERARKLGKIDIKAVGGYVLGPGSIHPTGAIYTPMSAQLFFPLVGALSEVLPVDILTRDAPVQSASRAKVTQGIDPWARASGGILSNQGAGVISKIRAQFKIQDFFPNAISTGGHWLMTACPFHQDAHPSLWIDTEKQICGCFAGCTPKPLDVINLYARLYSLDNRSAILSLADQL